MSTFIAPQNSRGMFLEINKFFPEGWDEFLLKFLDTYRDLATAINFRDISIYDIAEIPCGQRYFPITPSDFSSRVYRDTFRKVVTISPTYVGGLPAAPAVIPHLITFPTPNTIHFTRIYGVIERLGAPVLYIPIPNNDVHVDVDATNINITGYPAAYNGFFGQVVLEYTKN